MFVSFAQNFEDVMLHRALKDVDAGTYLDIGAHNPVIDSVSRGFYERGWRGVHVEPLPRLAGKLRADRPDETVLEVALGLGGGRRTLYSVRNGGLSTLSDDLASAHISNGRQATEVEVEVVTLQSVLDARPHDFHWMKIDVEGAEREVLESWGTSPARPWILVIEAVDPIDPSQPTHSEWEHLLIERGYSLAYFDGINRFYVSDTQRDRLAPRFSHPPNVFDAFVVAPTSPYSRERGKARKALLKSDRPRLKQPRLLKLAKKVARKLRAKR